jgi:hypothetical protein
MSDHDSAGAVMDPLDIAGLDDADKARVLTTFLGHRTGVAPSLHYVHATSDGQAPAYIFDDDTGMVYILD